MFADILSMYVLWSNPKLLLTHVQKVTNFLHIFMSKINHKKLWLNLANIQVMFFVITQTP